MANEIISQLQFKSRAINSLSNLAYLDIGFVLVVVAVFKIEKVKREFVFLVSICS